MSAPLSYFTRDKEHIKVFDFDLDPSKENALCERLNTPFPLPTPKAAQWSPDGLVLALVDPTAGVQVVSFAGGDSQESTIHTLPAALRSTQSFLWSPKSSFVVSLAPGQKGNSEPNIHVWRRGDSATDEYILEAAYNFPKLEKGARVIQWTPDESLCARLLPDGHVHILNGTDFLSEPLVDLKLSHAAQCFEFAPVRSRGALKGRIAIFVPDVRDDMQRVVGAAEVTIFEFHTDGGSVKSQDKVKVPVAAGQIAELLWNSTGSALIAHCQTEVDETGQSYYGGSKLVLISADGECQKDLMDPQEGLVTNTQIVQAVAWSPTRDEFIFIHGFQPSQASLFSWDERTKKVSLAKILLEKAHRNTIRFNHFGSLVCLAGFGNLAGQVDFFGRFSDDDGDEKCDFVRVSSCVANCTVAAEWAPDGRHFITSVLAPRMRVDNCCSIWRALEGTRVAGSDFEELFDLQWRPEPPESLRFLDVTVEEVAGASMELAKAGMATGGVMQKQAYRPPKARGEAASTVAAMMRGEVAAPDGDDRRKRQPRQMRQREEETNPSSRPEDMNHQELNNRRNPDDPDSHVPASPERPPPPHPPAPQHPGQHPGQRQPGQQMPQGQHPQQGHQQPHQQPQLPPPRQAPNRDAAAAIQQQQAQQQAAHQAQQLAQAEAQQRQREAQMQQQRDLQAAQQREQQVAQQQQRAAQQAQREQQARDRAAQQQASPNRPPPPTEVGSGVSAAQLEALHAAQAAQLSQANQLARMAAASGYPGAHQQAAALQRQQAALQHQQAQQLLQQQHLQQQQQERQRQLQAQQQAQEQARQQAQRAAQQQQQQQQHRATG
eukprot:CAMPEP_0177206908 /NCGR_PEP_ID=MMETSP0367-20130122/29635_1 /TAXON_ID=447022 ORGANISM="Scrippsiella hangoei-like, Strain SHHI-4" /NCGR_SAMPLE_ID=MMETSP0367 /ASSEMBLY_ACC=CAM_ASM_000362 /LENGTH=830 /DNA_ID=CAMNT_0018655709 /DNA_START=131 /DNA_END=2623 /DNA_ORIENTATION=-